MFARYCFLPSFAAISVANSLLKRDTTTIASVTSSATATVDNTAALATLEPLPLSSVNATRLIATMLFFNREWYGNLTDANNEEAEATDAEAQVLEIAILEVNSSIITSTTDKSTRYKRTAIKAALGMTQKCAV